MHEQRKRADSVMETLQTNNTDLHDKTEILLKVVLNTIILAPVVQNNNKCVQKLNKYV
jgi:predicted transcriptional regulator